LPRILSNRGSALVRGQRVPIIGRISMDVTVLNVTSLRGVSPGEVATFLGSDGSESITVDEVAEQAGTISHEILTGLTSRLPRVWVDEEKG
jgi:alanine racemase